MKKYCLNLEDMSKNMFDCIKSFYKLVEQKGGEKVGIDKLESLPKYTCKITHKMCIANSVKNNEPTDSGLTVSVEYNECIARKCPYYSELQE